MNAIIGMSTLGRNADSMERKDYAFDKIDTASNHLLGIINDILDMSKIEAGMFLLSNEPFELENIINNVSEVSQFLLEQKSQKFVLNIDEKIPKIIVADKQRLAQVLTNLLSNACKFTEDGKEIKLSAILENTTDETCEILFTVADEGIGLSAAQQDKLFKSFVQAENDTTRKYGGTGLGLAISKHIVELMGGKIWVESEIKKGSTFSFTITANLPNTEMLEELSDIEGISISSSTFPGRRLLLAEDVDINREIIIAMLEDTQLEIICAENGEEALNFFTADPAHYDIIFMDIHMPIMDGYTATEKIRAYQNPHAKKIPIIAMTANVFREDIEKCLASGMDAHIGKPVDFDAVREVLQKYL
jgi:CheY-like chemotaxis protein/two-component sensor histidine kinase